MWSLPIFQANPEPPAFPLVDVHMHVGTTDNDGVSYGRLPPEVALRWMEEARVGTACVFSPLRTRYADANRALRGWAATTNGRALPFARLRGTRGPRPVRSLWQARASLRASVLRPAEEEQVLDGMAGVKLLPHLDGLPSEEAFAAVRAARLPVLIHTGVDCPPGWVARHVLPQTSGPLILAHLGCFPCDERLLRAAVALAEAEPRVWLDTSAAWMAGFVRYAAERVPSKLLFGSDAPLMHPATAWAHVASALPGDPARLRAVGRDNALRLLGRGDADLPALRSSSSVSA